MFWVIVLFMSYFVICNFRSIGWYFLNLSIIVFMEISDENFYVEILSEKFEKVNFI